MWKGHCHVAAPNNTGAKRFETDVLASSHEVQSENPEEVKIRSACLIYRDSVVTTGRLLSTDLTSLKLLGK